MIRTQTLVLASLSLGLVCMTSCRPRATRSTAKRTPATNAATAQPSGAVSAKTVLTEADSALAHVAALSNEDEAPPMAAPYQMQPPPYMPPAPRTPWGSSYVPRPDPSAYGLYEAALGAYNGRQYDDAIQMFSRIVNSGQPPELVPNAYYWMGESFYATGRYAESKPYFEYVTKVGPQYKREMALYKLSRADLHMGNKQGGNLWYERLRNEYPRSSYVKTLKRLGAR